MKKSKAAKDSTERSATTRSLRLSGRRTHRRAQPVFGVLSIFSIKCRKNATKAFNGKAGRVFGEKLLVNVDDLFARPAAALCRSAVCYRYTVLRITV